MVEKKFLQGMHPWHYYYQLKNEFDFAIRNRVRWNRFRKPQENIQISSILSEYNSEVKFTTKELVKTFHLDEIRLPFHHDLVEVNLYYLDLLIKSFENLAIELPNPLNAVDVGPSDWFYLPALVSFLRYFGYEQGRQIIMDGYEIDPYRIYSNFYARHTIAQQRVDAFEHVQYHMQPFVERIDHFDLALQCFPFLLLKDHLSWGLPKRLFNPKKLLHAVTISLKQNGILLIINQGLAENRLQKELLSETGMQVIREFQFTSEYKQYDHEHYVLVVKK